MRESCRENSSSSIADSILCIVQVSSICRVKMLQPCIWRKVDCWPAMSAKRLCKFLNFLHSAGLTNAIRQLDIPSSTSTLPNPLENLMAPIVTLLSHLSIRNTSTVGCGIKIRRLTIILFPQKSLVAMHTPTRHLEALR